MRYKSFSLENFRGISDELKISTVDFLKIISIIGNNESGKTTILQGIECIGDLCKGCQLDNGNLRRALPKWKNAGFVNVDTIFKCEILFSDDDINILDSKAIATQIKQSDNIVECIFMYSFKNSLPTENTKHTKIGDTKYEDSDAENLFDVIAQNIQDIVYLDDFLFTVPEEIVFVKSGCSDSINGEDKQKLNSDANQEWQNILNDILLATLESREDKHPTQENKEYSIQKDIVDFHKEGFQEVPSARVFGMGNYLNKLLTPWKDMHMQEQGNVCFDKFEIQLLEEVYIHRFKILIEAQNRKFSLGERSRGFQWFVCFVLFTEIRLHRNNNGTIFLLDEPASNLHILPQIDILQRMRDMCSANENVGIIYTTHSPFLVSVDHEDKDYSYTVQNSTDREIDEPKISCYKTCEYDEKTHQPSSILTALYGVVHKSMMKSIESTVDPKTNKKIFTLETLKKWGEASKIGSFIINTLKFFRSCIG